MRILRFETVLWVATIMVLPLFNAGGAILVQPPENSEAAQKESKVADPKVKKTVQPVEDLSWMPKRETGVDRFLKQHPDADGRDVVVAIFDTGVDPGAAGLQKTPDGRPKVIDIVDGTGSGDVTMKAPKKPEEGKLVGLTGRPLSLGPDWKNPTGEYRLGMKSGYELFPSELIAVIKPERERKFRSQANTQRAELAHSLADWKKAHPKPDDAQKKELAELEAQISVLDDMLKSYSDPGPLYDCVVFHDGENFCTVVDTDEDGDLAEEKVLRNYRIAQEFSTFPDPINMNFGVNHYDDGATLSIVCDTGAHGTHVAGIVAAYFPENPEWNGVAPGAQIVSVKIGDTRLDGMENGPGLVRGLKTVLDNKCDLINMSYGEPSRTPNVGRIAELYSEVVTDHGVIFVSSAGNAGPALSTVGAPGGTTSAILGVGAYVSPEMMRSEYSIRENLPGLPYTWTSRGPTTDGDFGVDIFAPGGAIAPVPQWTRQYNQQMNGTSMASPNACGNIALILSAAKQQKVEYNPFSVRRAVQNTAVVVPDAEVFAAGPGLIQVDKAWDYLADRADRYGDFIEFEVKLPTLHNARGIYLRDPDDVKSAQNIRAYVTPQFPESTPIEKRLEVNLTCNVKTTAPWVQTGDLMHIHHGGNRFDISVDPTALEPGVHYAEVHFVEMGDSEDQILLRIPVTVVIPEPATEHGYEYTEEFSPGIINRHFFDVPDGATSCTIEMELVDTAEPKFFRLHTMQLVEGEDFEHLESGNYYQIIPGIETEASFAVVPGRTLEVVMGPYWSIMGDSKLKYEVSFHGVAPADPSLTLATGQGVTEVHVRNELDPAKISPSAKLTKWRRLIAPKSHEVIALGQDRDLLPDGSPVYELHLKYDLKVDSKTSVTLSVPVWDQLLYDSQIGPFITHIFDSNGKRIVTNDMFADPASLSAGTYTVELVTQHKDPALLDGYGKQPLIVDRNLSKPVSLKFWSSPATAAAKSGAASTSLLKTDDQTTFYLGEPDAGQLPSGIQSGDCLMGEASYYEDAATHFEVKYFYAGTSSSSAAKSSSDKKSLDEQIRELKEKHLKSLDPESDEFAALFKSLTEEKPEDRDPLVIRLEKLDSEKDRKKRLDKVIEAADAVIESFDTDNIAARLSKRAPEGDKDAAKAIKEAEAEKKSLIDALYRKVRAIAYKELPDVVAENPIADQKAQDEAFETAYRELSVWQDVNDKEFFLVQVRKERRAGHYAQAIQLLNKHMSGSDTFLYHKKRRDLFKELNWEQWEQWEQTNMLLDFPNKALPYK